MNLRPAIAVFFVIAFPAASAIAGGLLDLQVRFPRYHVTIVLDEQARATESREWSRVVLKESALTAMKTAAINFSTSAQTGEIIEAYTLKADGRRLDVPKDNYQVVVNRGKGKDSPVYSDLTSLSVVFPDVAVGDTEVFSYRLITKDPLFPGKFSAMETFSSQAAYDDVHISVDYPSSLPALYGTFGMEQSLSDGAAGRKVVDWRWSNPAPVKEDRDNWSIVDLDQQTHFSFSTFTSYADISAAYGARATPKATVTDRIRKLADDIVGKTATPREQAGALYEWVATKISYAGNCIGIGAVVPRDLPFVLDNKIGDCKDHATLLQALLAARGIQSTQALINAGSVYKLPKIPVVSTVNHVINYIPSLDLYLDSTSSSTPFGRLPRSDQGKPVLLVDGFRPDSRTPVPAPESNGETTKAIFTIAANGSVTGSTRVSQVGDGAAATRAWARNLTRNVEDDMVRDLFRAQSLVGSGTFTKDDPSSLSDTYNYQVDYNAEKYLQLPGAGAFYVSPPTGAGSVQKALQFTEQSEQKANVVCQGSVARDEYEIRIPKELKLLSIPDDVKLDNAYVAYTANYRLKGTVLTITRALTNKITNIVCSPIEAAEYKKVGDNVLDDLRSQVLFKLPKPRPRS